MTNKASRPQTRETCVSFNECQHTLFLRSQIANVPVFCVSKKYGIDIKEKASIFEMKEEEEKEKKNPNASSSKAWFVTLQGTSPFKPWNCLPDLCHYLDRQARWWVSEAHFFLLSGVGAKLNLGKLDLNSVFVKNITLTRVSVVHIHCKHWKLCKKIFWQNNHTDCSAVRVL